MSDFNFTLSGVLDREGPQFYPAFDYVHPLDFPGVNVNELLPVGTTAQLVYDGTMAIPMTGLPAQSAIGVSGFDFTGKALAFATTYSLQILPAAVDMAGNLSTNLPSTTTFADPGIFAQDGFEGPLSAYLAEPAAIVDGTSLPIPAGKKALGFPPESEWNPVYNGRFTARLAVPAGAKTIKFSYLTYWPNIGSPSSVFPYRLAVATPNGVVTRRDLADVDARPLSSPWPSPLPGSADNSYSDLKQLELPLPVGTGQEVIFDIAQPAFGTSDGLVIDDLRIE